jgi:hypothetical protein
MKALLDKGEPIAETLCANNSETPAYLYITVVGGEKILDGIYRKYYEERNGKGSPGAE